MRSILSSAIILLFAISLNAQKWEMLFDGTSLENWEQKNGEAEYKVQDGEILGITRYNTPNSFLCTKKTYGDFILELDVKVEGDLNSGIQIRSESYPEYRKGRVHGYQVEIDPSDRAWSGGIYDEGRRDWIYPLTRNEKSNKAYKHGEWNHFRIEAVGNSIRTWINGIQCANLADDMTPEGFIALQVHKVGSEDDAGQIVRWKNIKILENNVKKYSKKSDPDVPEVSWLSNELTDNEIRHGWRFLWDGKTTKGWRGANATEFPSVGWAINDGRLEVLASGGQESGKGGDIVTEEEFISFELELDYMITEGANSGIKIFVVEGLVDGPGSAIGLEYQIHDVEKEPGTNNEIVDIHSLGALYDLIPAKNISEGRTRFRVNGVGDWNKVRIIVNGKKVEHWLNNLKLVEYERGSAEFRELVAKSKFAKYPGFGEAESGHILLQEHGGQIAFRSIKIREL